MKYDVKQAAEMFAKLPLEMQESILQMMRTIMAKPKVVQ